MSNPKSSIIEEDGGYIILQNVIVSFPNIWEPGSYRGKQKDNYDCQFIIPADQKDVANKVGSIVINAARELDPTVKKVSHLLDPKFGKMEDGNYFVKSSAQLAYPVHWIDDEGRLFKGSSLTDDQKKQATASLYAGSFCNVKLRITPSRELVDITDPVTKATIKMAKVWVNLVAIQFSQNGTPLGGASDETLQSGFGKVNTTSKMVDMSGIDDTDSLDDFTDDTVDDIELEESGEDIDLDDII